MTGNQLSKQCWNEDRWFNAKNNDNAQPIRVTENKFLLILADQFG